MVRILVFMGIIFSIVQGEQIPSEETRLYQSCIRCHVQEQVPSELIYRRYLMKYSSHKRIQDVIFEYLQKPEMEKTIMPKQFFMKFSQKAPSSLKDEALRKGIEAYLNFYDIKKRLEVPTP